MAREDRQRWNERHAGAAAAAPSAPRAVLVGAAEVLPPPGRALDLACGRGAEAVWLAERGWQVDAVDIADTALEEVARAADAAGVRSRLRVVQADLGDGLPASCPGPYDLLVMGHFRTQLLETAIGLLLRPGAVVVTSRLSVVGRDATGGTGATVPTPRPDGIDLAGASGPAPAYLAGAGELRDLAERLGLEVLHWEEGAGQTALVARVAGAAPTPRATRPDRGPRTGIGG